MIQPKIFFTRYSIVILLMILHQVSYCQAPYKVLTIEDCYNLTMRHYPLAQQREIIRRSADKTISNLNKNNFPQLSVAGQATYQSDVTSIPLHLPGVSLPTLDKEQYKIYGEVSQPLLEWYTVSRQKEAQESSAEIDQKKLDVDLYALHDRINQIYFGLLYLGEQTQQVRLTRKDIETNLQTLTAAYENGTTLHSNVDVLKAELLKVDQRLIEISKSYTAYLQMLALLIGQPIDESCVFERPELLATSDAISRPELTWFQTQKKSLDVQDDLLIAKNLPRLSLFWQSGYGKPALNIMKNDFDYYYIGGIKLMWSFSGFYTYSKEKELIELRREQIDLQEQTFLLNTSVTLRQQKAEIEKLDSLLTIDEDIIALRTAVKNSSNAQLHNGIITASDFIRDLNAEDQAKQSLLLHRVQLLLAQYQYQTTAGFTK